MTCNLTVPDTFYACGEMGNYCSHECLRKAQAILNSASDKPQPEHVLTPEALDKVADILLSGLSRCTPEEIEELSATPVSPPKNKPGARACATNKSRSKRTPKRAA